MKKVRTLRMKNDDPAVIEALARMTNGHGTDSDYRLPPFTLTVTPIISEKETAWDRLKSQLTRTR